MSVIFLPHEYEANHTATIFFPSSLLTVLGWGHFHDFEPQQTATS